MLRIVVAGGGCSGFQYEYKLVQEKPANDDLVLAKDSATVLIDSLSLEFMGGAEIDYVDDLIGQSLPDQEPQRGRLLRLRHQLRGRLTSRSANWSLASASVPQAKRRTASGWIMSSDERVDAAIDAALVNRIVGCVVLVNQDGKTVYARAAGLADREAGPADERDAIFRLASVTKPIVATTALAHDRRWACSGSTIR